MDEPVAGPDRDAAKGLTHAVDGNTAQAKC